MIVSEVRLALSTFFFFFFFLHFQLFLDQYIHFALLNAWYDTSCVCFTQGECFWARLRVACVHTSTFHSYSQYLGVEQSLFEKMLL